MTKTSKAYIFSKLCLDHSDLDFFLRVGPLFNLDLDFSLGPFWFINLFVLMVNFIDTGKTLMT